MEGAAKLYLATAELGKSIDDPEASQHYENAGLVRCGQKRHDEAVSLLEEAYNQAVVSGVIWEKLIVTCSNLIIARVAREINKPGYGYKDLEKLIGPLDYVLGALPEDQKAVRFEALLAEYELYQRLGRGVVKLREKIEALKAEAGEDIDIGYVHPGVREAAQEIFGSPS